MNSEIDVLLKKNKEKCPKMVVVFLLASEQQL